LSLDAPSFSPVFNSRDLNSAQANLDSSALQLPTQQSEAYDDGDLADADFGGYKNRHLNADQIAKTKIKTQQEQEEAESKKVYSVQLMLSLRPTNKSRPVNMALLDFPHKKKKGQFR